jgi:glycerophosphoryl diester phosphodiesterase
MMRAVMQWPLRKKILAGLAAILIALSLLNASWIAPKPTGNITLIAHRGVAQMYDTSVSGDCTAKRIYPPEHDVLENTEKSIKLAARLGGDMVAVDIAPTKDGQMVLFRDDALDCRTDGNGAVGSATLAELKTLDIGYGYTADGGRSFPFRGQGVGLMPTAQEALAANPKGAMLFNFKTKNAAEADQLFAIIKASGRDPVALKDGFTGAQAPVDRIRTLIPGIWAFSLDETQACTRAYVLTAWTGILPGSCRGKTIGIPLNYQFVMWGWPNRLIDRMASSGGKVIVFGPYSSGGQNTGLTTAEQLGEIPDSFKGYIWVDAIREVGPALKR